MATIDELENRIQILEGRLNTAVNSIGKNQSDISDVNARVDTTDSKVVKNTTAISNLRTKHNSDMKIVDNRLVRLENYTEETMVPFIKNHDFDIYKIFNGNLWFTKIRSVRSPRRYPDGCMIFIPDDITEKEFQQYNESISNQITFHWFTKIFNPNGYGKISFDLDKDNGKIKSITLGQNTRMLIPTGLKLAKCPSFSSLKISNEYDNAVYKGLMFTIEYVPNFTEELVIGVSNPTCCTISLEANAPMVKLVQQFTYDCIPELLTNEQYEDIRDLNTDGYGYVDNIPNF